MFARALDDRAAGQERLQVQPHMTFGRRFAPTMLGPVQRACHQPNRCRVHHMNESLETKDKTGATIPAKPGLQSLQMLEHPIEQPLGHFRIASPIRVRKRIFTRRLGPAQSRDQPGMQSQRIADIV